MRGIAEVFVWGRGEYGRLGLGDRSGSSRLRATLVKAMEGHKVVQVGPPSPLRHNEAPGASTCVVAG